MGIQTHTKLDGRRDERPQMNRLKYRTGMQQPNEETYPGLLLVNMKLLYPHRE